MWYSTCIVKGSIEKAMINWSHRCSYVNILCSCTLSSPWFPGVWILYGNFRNTVPFSVAVRYEESLGFQTKPTIRFEECWVFIGGRFVSRLAWTNSKEGDSSIFEPYIFPYKYLKFFSNLVTSYVPAYWDGTERVIRKLGIWIQDAGELRRRKHTAFRTRRNLKSYICRPVVFVIVPVSFLHSCLSLEAET